MMLCFSELAKRGGRVALGGTSLRLCFNLRISCELESLGGDIWPQIENVQNLPAIVEETFGI